MKKHFLYLILIGLLLLSFTQCAKRGRPTGGKRDTIPPKVVKSTPENFTTQFKKNEIRIYFNEYIKLKNINKELIVSPPLTYAPIIYPLSTAKYIKIKILDTLKENTTYSFNFGKSIVDNNEENEYPYFKYIFSTGSYIDSLTLSGKVKDALLPNPEKNVVVMLYEKNQTYNDSLVFSKKPTYITVANDSTGSFTFENLKEGNYKLVALKEKTNDYIFQPKTDKIGFVATTITVPSDSSYTLTLFKETPDFKFTTPKHNTKNHILFGYEGIPQDLNLSLLSKVADTFSSKQYYDFKKDTLHYWFKPSVAVDTLVFLGKSKNNIDTLFVRIKDLYKDSLQVKTINTGTQKFNDSLHLQLNTPIETITNQKIVVTDKDTLSVPFSVSVTSRYNIAHLFFPKTENQKYKITLLPGAVTDFYGNTNDTLTYRINTKSESDYGSIALTLKNASVFPLLVELVNTKFKVVDKIVLEDNKPVLFSLITPGNYYVRIVFDTNKNGKWDTGNFLKNQQPERILYYPSQLEVRPNWSLQETFILE